MSASLTRAVSNGGRIGDDERVFSIGTQRQRSTVVIELAILQPGTRLFNTDAPGFRQ